MKCGEFKFWEDQIRKISTENDLSGNKSKQIKVQNRLYMALESGGINILTLRCSFLQD